jgi:hypothetical protein
VTRAGARLLQSGILVAAGKQLGIEQDHEQWSRANRAPQGERAMTDVHADDCHPKAMTGIIVSDDNRHQNRCQESSLFRRPKDSKDRLKTYKKTSVASSAAGHRFQNGALSEQHPAGAARPIPGKYDCISKN